MRAFRGRPGLPFLLAAALAAATTATAQTPPTSPIEREPSPPLAPEDLSQISGGQGVHVDLLSNQQLTATSSGNSVTANTIESGDVSFSSGSLQGFSGIGNFVINTGANNNLQGSISVSIVTTPSP